MFITFGKMINKSKFHIGVGFKITKTNAVIMCFGLAVYYMFMLLVYAMVGMVWVIYAMGYGIYTLIKRIVQKSRQQVSVNDNNGFSVFSSESIVPVNDYPKKSIQYDNVSEYWICPVCDEKNPRLAMNCKGCGKIKPTYNYQPKTMPESNNNTSEYWICPVCGEKNPRLSMNCKGCGKTR